MILMKAPPVCELKGENRTELNVIRCLMQKNTIGHWDFDHEFWLRKIIKSLVDKGLVKSEVCDYPLLKWEVTKNGKELLYSNRTNDKTDIEILTSEEQSKVNQFIDKLISDRNA